MKKKEKAFDRARKKAESVARDPEKVKKIVDSALRKAAAAKTSSQFQEISDKFQALVRLVRSWLNREYRAIPWQTIILAVTAIVYFVTPFDAIFDFIPLLGFADDVAVLTAVISSINHDLDKFMAWEKNPVQGDEPDNGAIDADFEEVPGEGQPET